MRSQHRLPHMAEPIESMSASVRTNPMTSCTPYYRKSNRGTCTLPPMTPARCPMRPTARRAHRHSISPENLPMANHKSFRRIYKLDWLQIGQSVMRNIFTTWLREHTAQCGVELITMLGRKHSGNCVFRVSPVARVVVHRYPYHYKAIISSICSIFCSEYYSNWIIIQTVKDICQHM